MGVKQAFQQGTPDWHLGNLAQPEKFTCPIDITGEDVENLKEALILMQTIRLVEERIADKITDGEIGCPCHLAIGQEAIAVGVAQNLRQTDRVFGTHRSHAHYIAQGGDLRALFAEVLGKATGCSKGMGGSMHLYDGDKGFLGSVPIVSATISLAVGAGLSAHMEQSGDIGVAYFGDGATEEGTFHEALNFAANYQVPVLFVCENNLFSSHLHIKHRQPYDSVARFAAACGMVYEVVDGNDVVAITRSSKRLIERARRREGPGFLEAVTYRWRGHVGPSEDVDVGVKRKEDLFKWKKRDPIRRLKQSLEQQGWWSPRDDDEVVEKLLLERINKAWNQAEADPYPEASALLNLVYS